MCWDPWWRRSTGNRSTSAAPVKQLRRALDPGRSAGSAGELLARQGPEYVLRLGADDVDAERFAGLVARREYRDSGDPVFCYGIEDYLDKWDAVYRPMFESAASSSGNEQVNTDVRTRMTNFVAGRRAAYYAQVRDDLIKKLRHGLLTERYEAASVQLANGDYTEGMPEVEVVISSLPMIDASVRS